MTQKPHVKIKLIISFLTVFILAFSLCFTANAMEKYSFDEFNVDITVDEYNNAIIKEDLKVNYKQPCHGIIRFIPTEGIITRPEPDSGKQISYDIRSKIKNAHVENFEYDTEHDGNNYVIKIGSEDKMVTGVQNYKIQYTFVNKSDDQTKKSDYFYYNLTGSQHDTVVENGTFRITFPKPFDEKNIEFISGKYNDISKDNIEYSVEGNTITAKLIKPLNNFEGVTLNLLLNEGYFTNKLDSEDAFLWLIIISIIIIALTIVVFILWFFFGNDRKLIVPINFYPPKNINSADAGFLINNYANDSDIISLIIYWANDGTITIDENDKELTLNKLKELPQDADDYQKTLFNNIFSSGDSVKIDSLKEKLYSNFQKAKTQLNKKFSGTNSMFTKISRVMSVVVLMFIPLISILYFVYLYIFVDPFLYETIAGICYFLGIIALALWGKFSVDQILKGKILLNRTKIASIFAMMILISIGFIAFNLFALHLFVMPLMCCITSVIISVFYSVIVKRTEENNQVIEQLLGLKDFIEKAELDKLNALVEENPSYFYNILPYAYVFGLTDKWAKKFESIAIPSPDWYSSSNLNSFTTYMMISSLSRNMNSISTSFKTPPPASSSRTGGSGGFTGGGGFAGGGFGGGGSSSW